MTKPTRFKLKNGLNATLYPPRSRTMKWLLKCLRDLTTNPLELFAIGVEVDGETLYLIYFTLNPPKVIVEELKESLDWIPRNLCIIYREVVYSQVSPANIAFATAIVDKINPCAARILF